MSVRRLAKEQPDSFVFNKKSEGLIKFWLAKYPDAKKASALIPMLWIAQEQEGWVCEPALRDIAARLEMPYIRVYEVVTFYTMFNLSPVGEHFVQLCGTTPCWLRGSDDLKAVCKKVIGDERQVSSDGKLSWMEVECLGACANAPMVQVNDDFYEDLDAENFEKLLTDLREGRPVKVGPQGGRKGSEPAGQLTSLTEVGGAD